MKTLDRSKVSKSEDNMVKRDTIDLRQEESVRSGGGMGDKWLAGWVTLRQKRNVADLQI